MNNFKEIEKGIDYVLDEIKYQIAEAKVRNDNYELKKLQTIKALVEATKAYIN